MSLRIKGIDFYNIYLIILYGIILFVINKIVLTDWWLSFIFVFFSFMIIVNIWRKSTPKISLFLLFIITFQLFIGGRFFVCLFDSTFSPFTPTFFYDYNVSYKRKIEIIIYTITFLFFSSTGNIFFRNLKIRPLFDFSISAEMNLKIQKLLDKLFLIFFVLTLYMAIQQLLNTIKNGYAFTAIAIEKKTIELSLLDKFLPMMQSFFLALSIAYGRKKQIFKYLFLYMISSILILLGGSRASFGALILILIWVYSMYYKISFIKFSLGLSLSVFILLFLFSFSVRSAGMGSISIGDSLETFLYTNGISLMVFDTSRLINDYPILPYFQMFIPGASFIYRLFANVNIYMQDITFEGHMCYSLNPELFSNGLGLGWTIMSDIYLISGKLIVLYALFSFLFGTIIGLLENWAAKCNFHKYVLVAIAPSLLMVARGPLSTIFPMFFYIFLFFLIIRSLLKRISLN